MNRTKRLSVGAMVAVLALFGSALIGNTAVAKKKKKSKPVTVSNNTPRPIPEAVLGTVDPGPPAILGTTAFGQLATPLTVSKKKGKGTVGRVAITFQATTGGGGTDTLAEFMLRISAPDGTTYTVVPPGSLSGVAAGPLTIQPNSSQFLCAAAPAPALPPPPPCADPSATVNPPFVGTAGDAELNDLNGTKIKGTWNVTAYDTRAADPNPPASEPVQTNILNSVSLKITPQKPVV